MVEERFEGADAARQFSQLANQWSKRSWRILRMNVHEAETKGFAIDALKPGRRTFQLF